VSHFFDKPRRGKDEYLAAHPHLLRWINHCVSCGARGYKPELPATIRKRGGDETAATTYLRRYFEGSVSMPMAGANSVRGSDTASK
jgi:hypothetical protein